VLQEPGELMRSGHCSAGAVMWDSPSYVHVHARSVRALGAFDTHLHLCIYRSDAEGINVTSASSCNTWIVVLRAQLASLL
jgi:hypothetical protein